MDNIISILNSSSNEQHPFYFVSQENINKYAANNLATKSISYNISTDIKPLRGKLFAGLVANNFASTKIVKQALFLQLVDKLLSKYKDIERELPCMKYEKSDKYLIQIL